ncbi:hypothetical protein EJ02DRAFT_386148 [Clathrospora elynae]|uniref:CFEM domain-containing protein n=1 Tax=Clathrospora elynae TaxID=706981 RepID=A0A6A5SC83_9PLEO|nr:hypothetical protein EJ02DRAFT_386148 [Clathrospora elynae]
MRPSQFLLPLLAWVQIGFAQDSGLLAAVEQLPKCALLCLTTAVTQSPCKLTDATCICTNAELQSSIEACVMQSCTLRQSLTTKNLTSTACHAPVRYSGNTIRITNIVLGVIGAAFTLLRIIYKAVFSIGEIGADDYSVFAVTLLGVPSVVMIDRGIVPNGLGMDVWKVPFDHITNFVRWLYVLEAMYFLQIATLKLTLLFFFLRIFPKPLIRKLLWATIAFTTAWATSFVIAGIFQCQPISYYWTSWDKERPGKCMNINALAWSNAIINVVLDMWMLALPLYEVFQLQMSTRKKLSVAVMFCVGTFVTVVSILRLKSLVKFAVSSNPTWDQAEVIHWSNIEINTGIICACLPAVRVVLVRMFPSILGSSSRATKQHYYVYGSRSHGMKKGASALASGPGKSFQSSSRRNPHAITFTKTFEVRHAESDEQSLVQMEMDQFGPNRSKHHSSNSTSAVSL